MATITNNKSLESAVEEIMSSPSSATAARGTNGDGKTSVSGGSVIDEDVLIHGDIIAHSDLTLHGTVEGNISCENGDVTIFGAVQGNVECKSLQLEKGKVEGNINVRESINAQEGTDVKGDISADSADLSGHSEGTVVVAKDLQLNDSAVIVGDVKAGSVCISSGSMIRGKFDIGFDAAAESKGKNAPQSKTPVKEKDDAKK